MEYAVRRDMYVNQANAEERYSTGYTPAMAKLENESCQLHGQTAQDALTASTQELIELRREYASQLQNPFVLDGIQRWKDPGALTANARRIVHQEECFGTLHASKFPLSEEIQASGEAAIPTKAGRFALIWYFSNFNAAG